jgi:ligand-binding sensor domain-containing protein/DNA-binding CsgD family transcriptional regulator
MVHHLIIYIFTNRKKDTAMRLFIVLLFFCASSLFAQNTIGLPDIINYTKQNSYKAGLQNWEIKQSRSGVIYIANNEGLLSFDGRYWETHPLPNKTIVRSIEIATDSRIYAGGQDEIGYFEPSATGSLLYKSLIDLIPQKDRSFGDVWDIVSYNKELFFRTGNKIFRYNGINITVYNAPSEWSYLGMAKGELYAHDFERGVLKLQDGLWKPVSAENKLPKNDQVTGIVDFKNGTLTSTLKSGMFLLTNGVYSQFTSPTISAIQEKRIFVLKALDQNRFALGTNSAGIYIVDDKGNFIQKFSKEEGLQNNNILSICIDNHKNLWLGLDNGIDYVAYNSAIKKIIPMAQDGPGYAAIIHQNNLYIGTSNGLFNVGLQQMEDLSFSRGNFTAVKNTIGQVWGLSEINDKLLMGHHEGAFTVTGTIASKIVTSSSGVWNFLPESSILPTEKIIAGNYKGILILNTTNGKITEGQKINNFEESSRYVAIDRYENIWVSHPYHGVYKITKNKNGDYQYIMYGSKNGLPSNLNNHIFKLKGEIVCATIDGIYTYDYNKNQFSPSTLFKGQLGKQSIRYLKEDTNGNIWFIHEKNLGVIDLTTKDTSIIYIPELNNKLLSGFEMILPINQNNILISGERGLYHLNYEKYKKNIYPLVAQIRNVKIINTQDSLLFGGFNKEDEQINKEAKSWTVPSKFRTIRINYSSPLYGQQENLEFSYRLKGFNEAWSEWTSKTEKEFTNLREGNYTFEVKVRNSSNNESKPTSFKFEVLPPWYRTTLAMAFYFFLFIAGFYLVYRKNRIRFKKQQVKHDEEQKKLQYLHQLEIDKAEKELIALRNEKLQAEIDFKNSELATTAMHLVQKGELITKLKNELNQVLKGIESTSGQSDVKKMIKILAEDEKKDSQWENFAQHFDKVHNDFLIKLKEKHPTLSNNELKLAAYLRMNLSTKEIAQLMNISVRGVEISRYRLRKKLGIETSISLFDYLIQIE